MSEGVRARLRRRRRRDRARLARVSLFLLALLVGLGLGLAYSWLVAPRERRTAVVADLRADYRAEYVVMVGQGYAVDGDWALAEARLAALGVDDVGEVVLALLEDSLRQGAEAEVVRDLAGLAEALGVEGRALALFAPTPVGGTATVTAVATGLAEVVVTASPTLLPTPTASPTLRPSPTARATRLPTAVPTETVVPDYRLIGQVQVCQADLALPRIEVVVVDALLAEIPAVGVEVSWEGGTDRFVTGFKPEQGPGYADFTMALETSYSVGVAGGVPLVSGLRAERCVDGEGWQGWQLRFQNLR